jgi:DNA-binding NarL/FixJ family response regulator
MQVRTAVVTISPLLADIVLSYLQAHLPIEVIGVLPDRKALSARLIELRPDLVLLGLLDAESDACALPLLAALPFARILVLAPDGQHAWLHEMRPHRVPLRQFSKRSLLRLLTSRYGALPPQG